MTIDQLLTIAKDAWEADQPDLGRLGLPWDDTGELERFIETELRETFDATLPDTEQLAEAAAKMRSAALDFEAIQRAFEQKGGQT
jgi:hypothetical protein